MKLKLAVTLLVASMMTSVVALGSAVETYATQSQATETKTQLYNYNDGLYIRLLNTGGLSAAKVTVTFANNIQNANTIFFALPATTNTSATINGKTATINISDGNAITFNHYLDVAFIEFDAQNPVQSVKVEATQSGYAKTYSNYTATSTGVDYLLDATPSAARAGGAQAIAGFPTPTLTPDNGLGNVIVDPNGPMPSLTPDYGLGNVIVDPNGPMPSLTPDYGLGNVIVDPNGPMPTVKPEYGTMTPNLGFPTPTLKPELGGVLPNPSFPTPELGPNTGYIGPNPNVGPGGMLPTPEVGPGYIGPNPNVGPGGMLPTPEITPGYIPYQ
ncbi:hypothetical protein [Candidatus Epulonipiscium viviparus]|uniref:hypothetical protein n=1 Tax=Candidatus Epulonipiscium viviparus TaxID=420336 RepID=UPI0027380FB2|nr:hypothetical protein [Candidatus Epulopiscium viviparus]